MIINIGDSDNEELQELLSYAIKDAASDHKNPLLFHEMATLWLMTQGFSQTEIAERFEVTKTIITNFKQSAIEKIKKHLKLNEKSTI